MSKGPDENDRLRAGTLPKDPSADTERMKPAREPSRVAELGAEPCDLRAEKALLGALLWAGAHQPAALRVAQVLDILETGEPFYGRGLADLFDAMRECAKSSEHDPVAVHAELVRRGHLALSFDDISALKDEASTVSERQARVYSVSIRTAWARRCAARDSRLLTDAARDPKTTAEALLDQARKAITAMSERTAAAGRSVSLKQSAEALLVRLQSGVNPAMATGIRRLDDALNGGLRPGEVSVLGARTNVGKAHPVDTHVLTPTGWRRIGDLVVGDEVIGSSGYPCRVIAVHDRGTLDVYRVSATDGGSVLCCSDHLWRTRTRNERRSGLPGSVRSTADIASTVRHGNYRNHGIPYVYPVQFADHGKLLVHP
jgi:replicative DNA helicase